jgi:sugar phosphate isomerase/epimerase
MRQISRRAFLSSTAVGATAGIWSLPRAGLANDPIGRTRPSHLKLSLAAYSYKPLLQGPRKSMDMFDFVNRAADMGLDAVEPTSYYFPEKFTAEYLHRLRRHAFLLGLDISGTSVMNDFCTPPGAELDRDLAHVRSWIDYAAELNAPTVRILSGNWIQGTSQDELESRVVRSIESLLPHAADKGVTLALENHGGGVTTSADELLRIVRRVNSPYFGVNLDTGNYHTKDPYDDLARTAPYAVNVQVKTEIRREGKTTEPADLSKVIGILRDAKYSGYVVLEYTAKEDPMTAVPRYIKELRSLIS